MLILAAAVVLGATTIPADPTSDSPIRLELTLKAYKNAVVLYEPITLVYRVTNPTKDVITSSVNLIGIEFVVTAPDGKRKTQHRDGIIADVVLNDVAHEPGSVMISESDLAWRGANGPLPIPGSYEIRARVYAGTRPTPVYLESVDSKAIASFASEADFKRLLGAGPRAYCEGRNGPACFEELKRFVDEHGKSSYAPTITWRLADAVANGRVGVEPQGDSAVSLYRQFLRNWPEHPNASKVMYGLVMALDKAGRSGEAAEVIREFEKKFPEQKEKAKSLRTNSQAGEMLAPKP